MKWVNMNIMYADTHTPFKVVANIDLSIELSNPSVSDLSATKRLCKFLSAYHRNLRFYFQVTATGDSTSLNCAKLLDNDFTPTFTCNLALEAFILGSISLCLTLINIFFIVFSAMLFLKVSVMCYMGLCQ